MSKGQLVWLNMDSYEPAIKTEAPVGTPKPRYIRTFDYPKSDIRVMAYSNLHEPLEVVVVRCLSEFLKTEPEPWVRVKCSGSFPRRDRFDGSEILGTL